MSEEIKITPKGIKKTLAGINAERAIAEYIWNGFDAGATVIEITARPTAEGFETIDSFVIRDNGSGIPLPEIKTKFSPYLESAKAARKIGLQTSAIQGQEGKGRLTFFTFAEKAVWETVYVEQGQRYAYSITVESNTINNYEPTEKKKVERANGTAVSFFGIDANFTMHTVESLVIPHLVTEFGWYLKLNEKSGKRILINSEALDYRSAMNDSETLNVTHTETGVTFKVDYIQWKKRQEEYSKVYFLDQDQAERFKLNSKFNNKGDSFYHSLYVTSPLFKDLLISAKDDAPDTDDTQSMPFEANQKKAYKYIWAKIDEFLRGKRHAFLKETSAAFLKQLYQENVAPKFKDSDYDRLRKKDFDEVVTTLYETEPRFFLDLAHSQKKTLLGFLNLLLDSDEREGILEILQETLTLTEIERAELVHLLKFTKLNRIIAVIQLLKDRYAAVEMIKALVNRHDLEANEVNDLQSAMECHFWLFGEEFHLVTAAEPNFESALRKFCYVLFGDTAPKKIDHADKLRQMDIFAVRQNVGSKLIDSVVIELKHPDIILGEKELLQVKKYMSVILKQPEFNGSNRTWRFYLVGARYSDDLKLEITNNEKHGEPGLVFKVNNYRIYVKTWDEVFNDFEIRHEHLQAKLQLERKVLSKTVAAKKPAVMSALTGSTAAIPQMDVAAARLSAISTSPKNGRTSKQT